MEIGKERLNHFLNETMSIRVAGAKPLKCL